jgi:regulatory protein
MAGTITALQVQQKDKERVNVYLDGEYAFGLSLAQAIHLKRGQYLSDALIAELQTQDDREKAYNQALRYLGYRPRSQAEVERYLAGKGLDEVVSREVVERLTRAGLLNDADFARFWVENRQQFRPRGRMALRYEMRVKGLDEQSISSALGDVDEEESAYHLARAQAQKKSNLAPQELRRKLGQYLSRRGFSYAVIETVFRRIEAEREADRSDEWDDGE